MTSPMPYPPNGGWNPYGQPMPQNRNDVDESGVQVRPMGLKVHYSFDRDNKVNCLARSSQTIQVQTIPLDDKNSIGVVDLHVCLQAVTECSPELASQEGDYNVYALDYSEPDTPLAGQGMLSWLLEAMRGERGIQVAPKMVTGRVTRNVLALFNNGNQETLEVKLRLTPSAKVQRLEPQPVAMEMQPMRPMESAMTPNSVMEWNSFIQSNPQIGHSAHVSRVASPALSQGMSVATQRRDSFGPGSIMPMPENQLDSVGQAPPMPTQEVQRVAPVPVDPSTLPPQPTSRPSSRNTKRRRKQPTGRPRGRPRKKPDEGNISGYEEGTEGEDNPAPKRAKMTKVEKAAPNPFAAAGPESLRVAASTSGSLRNFRPVAANTEKAAGNHLQEVPRAPTPVPEGGSMNIPPRGGPNGKPRRESSMRQEFNPNSQGQLAQKPNRALSPSQEDGRSPESLAPTPAFSEDSPQDIGSSPPVARTTSFIRSSIPPSSPILPPMPQRADSGFLDTEMDDLFDETMLQPLANNDFMTNPPVQEVQDTTGIPTQVFRIKNGPDGSQEFVHIQNYNTPQTTIAPARPSTAEAASLPLLKNPQPRARNPAPKQSRRTPPATALTPPTTDAIEKAVSPAPVREVSESTTDSTAPSRETSEMAPPTEATSIQEAAATVRSNPSTETASKLPSPPKNSSRTLARSQSAGPLILPAVPASEPAGPSSLSQSTLAQQSHTKQNTAALRRSNSIGPNFSVPAAVKPTPLNLPIEASSEAPCPPSDACPAPSSPGWNKNVVLKNTIKQRLDEAIAAGEMPPFCTNCGAIETPTWRKIFVQDREGVPEYVEYSEKPGRITAIEILKRDEEDKPLSYRLIKKSLAKTDDKAAWVLQLLCNPCGIWVTKYRSHRPSDKWDNSFGRMGQERRKRGPDKNNSRAKKARTKSDSQTNPKSEAQLPTDPLGPPAPSSPKQADAGTSQSHLSANLNQAQGSHGPTETMLNSLQGNNFPRSQPGSTHSRGSGTMQSPIQVGLEDRLDEQLGSTRRILFPSPRKDHIPKVLSDVAVNIVQTIECRQNKELAVEKENMAVNANGDATEEHDDLEALLRGEAPARPSTPPPKAAGSATTPFKTPTRPTPSHRPITRSVSRSLRSVRNILMSPNSQALLHLQQTPTKTPRGSNNNPGSASRRRSPRHQHHFDNVFDTPISRSISQMLSDPAFDLSNNDLDLSSLPALDTGVTNLLDFGNFLSTDGLATSSPMKDGNMRFTTNIGSDIWSQWDVERKSQMDVE